MKVKDFVRQIENQLYAELGAEGFNTDMNIPLGYLVSRLRDAIVVVEEEIIHWPALTLKE